jgi:hypothetical protein
VRDAAVADTGVSDASAADAGGLPDASAAERDAEPAYSECTSATDCPLPAGLMRCSSCQDGAERCPEVACVDGFCATLTPACPEHGLACANDDACAAQACTFKCQGDGRDACFGSRCQDGVCAPLRASCGLQLEPCPPQTRAGVICGVCADAGACELEVIGCFQTCERDDDCPAGQPCAGGLCLLAGC